MGILLVLRKRKGNSICFCADSWLTTSFSWQMISKLRQIQGPHSWSRGPRLRDEPRGPLPLDTVAAEQRGGGSADDHSRLPV